MAVLNARRVQPRIVIPTNSDGFVKITITDSSDTVHTVMDTYSGSVTDNHTLSASVSKDATDKLGNFKITLSNDGGRFLNKFAGGELVKVYADYTDATTLIFAGRVDDVRYGLDMSMGFHIIMDGREYPELNDKTITGVEVGVTADISIAGIIDGFYNDIILKFWNGSSWSTATYTASTDSVEWSPAASNFPTTSINMSYENKKGWGIIKAVCKRAGLDAYIGYDDTNDTWVLRLFNEEDITNTEVNISYGINLTRMNDFGTRNSDIYNRIMVFGNTLSDNILLMKTEEDTANQDTLWVKDRIFNESDLSTMAEVQEKADLELAQNTDLPNTGRVSTLFMPQIRPGEKIYVTIPYCNLNGYYRVQSYTHNFGQSFSTTFDLEKSDKKLSELFLQKLNPDDFTKPVENINAMKDSYTVYFDEVPSVMTLTNCEESNGILRLSSGQTTGTAVSDFITTDYDVTHCEFRKYDNFSTDTDVYQVTNNGGVTWETYDISSGQIHTFNTAGDSLGFKITLNRTNATDASPAYEAICLLYKD